VKQAKMAATIPKLRAKQWSRAAWALSALFASLPLSSKLFVGVWGFDGAAELSFLCLMLGTYLHFLSRRRAAMRDGAAMMDQANQLARAGETEGAIGLLTKAIRLNPRLWQAFQYRGELYLRSDRPDAALQDFTEAIRLAPEEPHLYALRQQAQGELSRRTAT
jgi:tetratricopeptide (TPR) repeat protein